MCTLMLAAQRERKKSCTSSAVPSSKPALISLCKLAVAMSLMEPTEMSSCMFERRAEDAHDDHHHNSSNIAIKALSLTWVLLVTDASHLVSHKRVDPGNSSNDFFYASLRAHIILDLHKPGVAITKQLRTTLLNGRRARPGATQPGLDSPARSNKA